MFAKSRKLQKSIYIVFPSVFKVQNHHNLCSGAIAGQGFFVKQPLTSCTTVDLRETEVAPREPTEY